MYALKKSLETKMSPSLLNLMSLISRILERSPGSLVSAPVHDGQPREAPLDCRVVHVQILRVELELLTQVHQKTGAFGCAERKGHVWLVHLAAGGKCPA